MSNEKNLNIGFYVGRFQPFTKAHESLIKNSIKDHNLDKLIIFFGSINPSSNFENKNKNKFLNKNPYSMANREDFLRGSLEDLKDKIMYDGMLDYGSPKEEITASYLKELQNKYHTNGETNFLINQKNNIGGINEYGKNRTHERRIVKSTMWYYILAEKIFANIMLLKLSRNRENNINLYFINSPKNGPTEDYLRKINGITGRFLLKIINDKGLAKSLKVTLINAEMNPIKNINNSKTLNATTIRNSMKKLKILKEKNNQSFRYSLNIISKINNNNTIKIHKNKNENTFIHFKDIYDNYYLIKRSVPEYVFKKLLEKLTN